MSHDDVLRASVFSYVRSHSLRCSVIRGLDEVIGLIASVPGCASADLGADRFALLVSELHGRLRREFSDDEVFVEVRTMDVRLALRCGEDH